MTKLTQTWNGPTILRLLGGSVEEGAERRATVIRNRLRGELHRDTEEMAKESFAEVERRGANVIVSAGSDAEHTIYHELGTSLYPAHPQIRQIIDQETPHIGRDIAAAVAGRATGAIGRAFGRGR